MALTAMILIPSKKLRAYLISAVATSVTLAVQYVIIQDAKVAAPGLMYPASFLLAWFLGFGPALLGILGWTILSSFLFYQPFIRDFDDIVRLSIFTVTTTIVARIIARGKKTEDNFRELQVLFDRSVEASQLGVWYFEFDTGVLAFNRKAKEQFWIAPDETVTNEIFLSRIHPDDLERVQKAIAVSREKRNPYDIEYRTIDPTNAKNFRWIRVMGWINYGRDSKNNRYDGIILDYSRSKEMAQQRDESLEVIETVNRIGKTLSAELDSERLVQAVTDAATRLAKAEFGAFFYNVVDEQGEMLKLFTISGVPKEMFEKFPMPRNTQVFAPTFRGEAIVRSDDITQDPRYGKNPDVFGMPKGHLPVVSYMAVPVISRSGEVIGSLLFGHSQPGVFTEREEKLVMGIASQAAIAMDNARLFENANRAIRLRDEFLSISSHELRTPLTPLRMQVDGIARMLERGTLNEMSGERLKKMLTSADRQITRLVSLIDDLLDVSRFTSGKLNLKIEPVDLTASIHEIVERYHFQLQEARCEVEVQAPELLIAHVDRGRFEQILINLLTNAMRYAPGTPIKIVLAQVGDQAVLKVTDQGIGISVADQKRIFSRFERLASSSNYGGLGLGLFIVQQIVTSHQGAVSVESEVGKGSTFIIQLPIMGENA